MIFRGRQLGQHLMGKGLRSVLSVRPTLRCAVEQRKGLRRAPADAAPIVFNTLTAPRRLRMSNRSSDSLASAHPMPSSPRPTLWQSLRQACEQAGIRVPANLMIAGFNGSMRGATRRPL